MFDKNAGNVPKKAVRSAAWSYSYRLVLTLSNLVTIAILARQLSPAAFGLVALAGVIMRFNIAAGAATVGNYIIFDNEVGWEERVQAAFWLNCALVILTLLGFTFAMPLITLAYQDPLLPPVLAVVLTTFAIGQLAVVPEALIKKDLDFQKLVIRDTFIALSSAALSIIMALNGFGVWSLVLPGILLGPFRVILIMIMAHWHPTLPLRIRYWREIFNYTKYIIGSTILLTLNTDGDTLFIGSILGSRQLGIYNMAWNASTLTNRHIMSVVNSIAMPMLSAVKDDLPRLQSAYLQMIQVLSVVTFPMLLGLFVVANEFVLVVYGPQWQESVLILQILIFYAIRRTIGSPSTIIFNVVGRPDIGFKYTLYQLPIYALGLIIGIPYGLLGLAVAVVVTKFIGGIVGLYVATKLIKLTLRDLSNAIGPTIQSTLIMVIIIVVLRQILLSLSLPILFILLFVVLIGAFSYLIILRLLYFELLTMLLLTTDRLSSKLGTVSRKVLHISTFPTH